MIKIIDYTIFVYGLLTSSSRLFSPLRFFVRSVANKVLPHLLRIERFKRAPKLLQSKQIVVSLTSFPARILDVEIVIRCLLRQTLMPNKIILWLSIDQFENVKLPQSLLSLENDVFEIRWVHGDIRSHKKYYYSFQEFKDDYVILVDDDLYYESTFVEKMYNEAQKDSDYVVCRFGSKYDLNPDGSIKPYSSWWKELHEYSEDPNIFFGTGGGSIFQPNKIITEIFDIDISLMLTPSADDIWINAMVRLSGLKIKIIKCGLILQVLNQQKYALKTSNDGCGQNDKQLLLLDDYFYKKKGIHPFNYNSNH